MLLWWRAGSFIIGTVVAGETFGNVKTRKVIRIAISWLKAKSIHGKRLRSPPKKAKVFEFRFSLFAFLLSHEPASDMDQL